MCATAAASAWSRRGAVARGVAAAGAGQRRPGVEERRLGAGVDGEQGRGVPGARSVNTPIAVSVGSPTRSSAASGDAAGDVPMAITSPRPSPGSRSTGTVGAVLVAMRASRCSVWAATSGPRRSAPSVVTKRVVSPARSALWTTLAATVTARSKASSPASPGGVCWSSRTRQRRSPSTVCWRTFSFSERADARQWIVRGSSPST